MFLSYVVNIKLLNPINRSKKSGDKGIERMAKRVLDILGEKAVKKVFNTSDKCIIIYSLRKEFLEYQTEILRRISPK